MQATMQAIIRTTDGVSLREVAAPALGHAGDVRVRIALVGICRTDLYAADGLLATPLPVVLGHEATGFVESSSDGRGVGQRVAVRPFVACGRCPGCGRGSCERPRRLGVERDGAFAQYLVVPASSLVALPDALSPEQAAYVEPVAAALAVLQAPLPSGRGGVFGESRIAELTLRVLRASGREVVALAADADVPEGSFDYAVETQASELPSLVRAVRPRGLLVLKSRPPAPVPLDLGRVVQKELRLVGVHYGAFEDAVHWLVERRVVVDDLLGATWPLERFAEAFARARAGESQKLFLAPRAA